MQWEEDAAELRQAPPPCVIMSHNYVSFALSASESFDTSCIGSYAMHSGRRDFQGQHSCTTYSAEIQDQALTQMMGVLQGNAPRFQSLRERETVQGLG